MAHRKKSNLSNGDKIRAGRLLSQWLRDIAGEETELVVDPEHGDRMGTKAEAIARTMFKMAIGFEEEVEEVDAKGKPYVRTVKHSPDKTMIQLIWERLEGKAVPADIGDEHKHTVADRITDMGKSRIEAASGIKSELETEVKGTVSSE